MKKFVSVVFLAVLAAVMVLNGCGGLEADYTDDEMVAVEVAEPEVDEPTAEEPEAEPEVPTAEESESSECDDLDDDGYCGGPKDCNDSPEDADNDGIVDGYFVHDGADELCDWIDNDCDGKTDEGLTMYEVYIDNDGDGYGDSGAIKNCGYAGFASEPGDCDDSDETVHPGADDEAGDGVDSDCDDETAPVVEDPKADLSISIRYGYAAHRVLSFQVYSNEADLGGWWTDDEAAVSDSSGLHFEASFEEDYDPSKFLGVRLNVAEGDPATSWLCMGNQRTAAILEDVSIRVVFLGEVYMTEDVETWSAPNGAGCSADLKF